MLTALKLAAALCLIALVLPATPEARGADAPKPAAGDDGGSIDVEVVGVVRTGVMAIGGESTGTTVSALGFTWELDLAGNKALVELTERSDGKPLLVKGTLTVRKGVERGRRVIVVVSELKPAPKGQ
jgi:hypothetical protein